MKKLQVIITTEDFKNAPQFDSPEACPLSNALNRMYGEMGTWKVAIFNANCYSNTSEFKMVVWDLPYSHGIKWGNRTDGKYHPDQINELIKKAKEGKEIEEVNLEIETYDHI